MCGEAPAVVRHGYDGANKGKAGFLATSLRRLGVQGQGEALRPILASRGDRRWRGLSRHGSALERVCASEAGLTEASRAPIPPSSCARGVLQQGEALKGEVAAYAGLWGSERNEAMVVCGHGMQGGRAGVPEPLGVSEDNPWACAWAVRVQRVQEQECSTSTSPRCGNAVAFMASTASAVSGERRGSP